MASERVSLKSPPILENEEKYTEWKKDLQIWLLFTELAKGKQGPAVYLSVLGRAKECISDLKIEEIGADTGVQKITAKLDTLFLKDENTRAYLAFKEFYDYKRPPGVNITEFLVHFESLYHKLGQFDVKLPEGVQAFFLLNAVNVSEENERLARATCGAMTYANMKQSIQKIFGDPSACGEGSCAPAVKSEPIFAAHHQENGQASSSRYWRGRGRGTGRGRGISSSWSSSRTARFNSDRNVNPLDKDGKPMRCFKCNSTSHFSRFCDLKDKNAESSSTQEVHITLFNSRINEDRSTLVEETLGMAVLDCGCSKTVTGVRWLESYIDALSENDRACIQSKSSNTNFKFGDGVTVISHKQVSIPASIGTKRVEIVTEVVDNDIPLLLSKASMKKAGVILNFNSDKVNILGSDVYLQTTSSGHYCISLSDFVIFEKGNTPVKVILHTTALKEMPLEEKKKKALKLHRQFSHASKEKLCKLVKDSEDFNDCEFLKIIENVCDTCDICIKFKRPPLRPVVGMPLADSFNQVVSMDLKEHVHNKSWIFHMIDTATRYSAACLVYSKKPNEIISKIFSIWITYFGCPRKFLSDCGGEFSNDLFREMSEKLNIENATTAGESPFSNGIVERHNLVLADCMKKTMIDVECSPEMALAWAISSKNSLHNQGGFSPNQLVFGQNYNYPTVITDKIPALDQSTSNEMLYKNLQAMKNARENFIQSESSERIRRALRAKVRTYSDVVYKNGDKVYYRRKNVKGWKGPGVVLGQDGQMVLVRHGGIYYKVHPCQMMKVTEHGNKESAKRCKPKQVPKRSEFNNINKCVDIETDTEESSVEDDNEIENDGLNENEPEENENNFEGFALENNDSIQVENLNIENGEAESENELPVFETNKVRPKRNSFIKYRLKDSDVWNNAKILSSQPKKSGKYKNYLNVHVSGNSDPICVNWDVVDQWKILPDPESVVLLTKIEEMSQEVIDAKESEVNNLISNEVFEVVPFKNQTTISSRWIITEKVVGEEKRVKARLVARGFEEDSSLLVKDSPTCSRESLRLLFLTASMMSWELQSIDVTAAFLQGDPIEREIYLRPPKDVCPDESVWRLNRCIYGLNDAPRSWYEKVRQVLTDLGACVSVYDNALFLWHDDKGKLIGLLAAHVDDFAFCGDKKFQEIIKALKATFKIKEHHYGSFKYLGLNVIQNQEGVVVDQELYIPLISKINIPKNVKRSDELTVNERKELKRLSGQMMWVASQTRPDVSFETCAMSNTGKSPTVKMLFEANKAVTKLNSKKVEIKFPNLGSPRDLKILAFPDATYGSLEDGSSQGAFMIFVAGKGDLVTPVCWQSKKLNRVTKSPLASETLALSEAADAGFLISAMIQEIFQIPFLPEVECYTDNNSLNDTLKTTNVITDRRLRVDIARIREMVKQREIKVKWINGRQQIADCLTKYGASTVKMLETLESSKL